jgi:hypothetical protein
MAHTNNINTKYILSANNLRICFRRYIKPIASIGFCLSFLYESRKIIGTFPRFVFLYCNISIELISEIWLYFKHVWQKWAIGSIQIIMTNHLPWTNANNDKNHHERAANGRLSRRHTCHDGMIFALQTITSFPGKTHVLHVICVSNCSIQRSWRALD